MQKVALFRHAPLMQYEANATHARAEQEPALFQDEAHWRRPQGVPSGRQRKRIQAYVAVLDKVRTAVDWQMLSDADKTDIKKAGLHAAVINSLNDAVRVGLLLPAFKYADEVAFLRAPHFDVVNEARSVVEFAEQVDNDWVLTRYSCNALCHSYLKMLEFSMKLAIEHG